MPDSQEALSAPAPDVMLTALSLISVLVCLAALEKQK
jgi:hypothetical protein